MHISAQADEEPCGRGVDLRVADAVSLGDAGDGVLNASHVGAAAEEQLPGRGSYPEDFMRVGQIDHSR